jgi:Ca2+-binding RTX toxin-like protein
MSILFGTNGDDNIMRGAAADLIITGDGSDIVHGNGGDDVISSRR